VSRMESSFSHHLDSIAKAQLVAQVPAHAQHDHLSIKMPPRKQLFNASPSAHRQSSIPKAHSIRWHLPICIRTIFTMYSTPARKVSSIRFARQEEHRWIKIPFPQLHSACMSSDPRRANLPIRMAQTRRAFDHRHKHQPPHRAQRPSET
jgi:hypothetical protein